MSLQYVNSCKNLQPPGQGQLYFSSSWKIQNTPLTKYILCNFYVPGQRKLLFIIVLQSFKASSGHKARCEGDLTHVSQPTQVHQSSANHRDFIRSRSQSQMSRSLDPGLPADPGTPKDVRVGCLVDECCHLLLHGEAGRRQLVTHAGLVSKDNLLEVLVGRLLAMTKLQLISGDKQSTISNMEVSLSIL